MAIEEESVITPIAAVTIEDHPNMFPLLSLHAIAASRGDGLHPELLALYQRLAETRPIPVSPATRHEEKASAMRPDVAPQPAD
ncbi:hypothetical protein [Hypericibacter sp.]|uniref:hypothetical protein n=1 Tax=Hypericibacter sp. TaxID=2705401 RepID=UPI003D6CC955